MLALAGGLGFAWMAEWREFFLPTAVLSSFGILMSVISQRFNISQDKLELRDVFFEQSPLLFWSISSEGILLDCNQSALDKLGYTKEDCWGVVPYIRT